MMKQLLAAAGWIAALLFLWIGLVGWELYWNLFSWVPICDVKTAGLALWILLSLFLGRYCSRYPSLWFLRLLMLVTACTVLAAGIYACHAEPITSGLFGRHEPSPLLYRTARVLLCAVPLALWVSRALMKKPEPSQGQTSSS